MTKPHTSIDQQELEAAVVLPTEDSGDNESQQVHYRSPLDVAREEWRKKTYQPLHADMRPDVKANWPTARLLETLPPLTIADTVDMDAFNEAKANWPK